MRSSLRQLFRTEAEREADRHVDAGGYASLLSFEAAIPDHEKAARLDPNNRFLLATTYAGAGDERLGILGLSGPLGRLMSGDHYAREAKAEEILFWVNRLRQSENGAI